AFRLLAEEHKPEAIPYLKDFGLTGKTAEGRARTLRLLYFYKALEPRDIINGITDDVAGVREQAVEIARDFMQDSPELLQAVLRTADDESPRVRFLAALALGD